MGGATTGAKSIRDVARAAGVSVATVSRVMAGTSYPVAETTRAKVLEAARSLGFVPNALARSLARARSDSIGVVVPRLINPYYAAMIEGIDSAAQTQGLSMLLSLTAGDEARRETAISELLARRVDGLIICAGADDHVPGRSAETLGVPAVLIGRQPNGGFPLITTDNRQAGFTATEYLWSLGHRRFAYLTSHESWHDFHDRALGMFDYLGTRSEEYEARIFDGIITEADAYRSVREAYASGLKATAVLASTDRHALGALAALADADYRVPDDVAVMGFDDYVTSAYVRPSLTTMQMPAETMGRMAVAKLRALLDGGVEVEDLTLQATLIERGSTRRI
ncbi:LacI family DNA-binding transcriptional regulator [Rhizobium sp. NPDC090279]|uniref:LacI family DNA-binding transcriptional regulator n=1 Tax=Rhizobium sp. NPDC090279 TaxID=3364499 RepID=UPI00383A3A23